MAVWMPARLHAQRSAAVNSGCWRGSPPEMVTPPPERS